MIQWGILDNIFFLLLLTAIFFLHIIHKIFIMEFSLVWTHISWSIEIGSILSCICLIFPWKFQKTWKYLLEFTSRDPILSLEHLNLTLNLWLCSIYDCAQPRKNSLYFFCSWFICKSLGNPSFSFFIKDIKLYNFGIVQ